ncbi:MAG: hypothetical protein RBG13Loki_2995 [Promethearchaeota archaeon CR_4]|nr:MAG: hypothetical protein RBG13Loki_2995 [Candidatus Lokiarchaeota archaeon CR_4]
MFLDSHGSADFIAYISEGGADFSTRTGQEDSQRIDYRGIEIVGFYENFGLILFMCETVVDSNSKRLVYILENGNYGLYKITYKNTSLTKNR